MPGKRIPVTAEQLAKARRLVEEHGVTMADAARIVGIPRQRLTEAGIRRRPAEQKPKGEPQVSPWRGRLMPFRKDGA